MFVIRADTPDETRDAIVKWLKLNASNHRIKAGNAVLMGTRKEETAMANAYQMAADFWDKVGIERKV